MGKDYYIQEKIVDNKLFCAKILRHDNKSSEKEALEVFNEYVEDIKLKKLKGEVIIDYCEGESEKRIKRWANY